MAIAVFPSPAAAASSCQTSGPAGSTYTISVCLDQPADGATLSGDTSVSGSSSVASGAAPSVQRLVFYVDGTYALTDYEAPYSFSLPTSSWVDGSHRIEVEALLRDGFVAQRAGVNVTFHNGVTIPPVNTKHFTPTSGTTPAAGKPFVLAAAGDGAGGETSAQTVVNRMKTWSPNLLLYLGDVYEKGAPTEFKNWYGAPTSTLFGQFRSITDPVVGNHEYSASPTAAGYFDFWDNIPHYYSYNANGWHFIALDSTSQFGQTAAGSPMYKWLQDDLRTDTHPCTVAYFHHPPWNIGSEGYTTRMDEIWSLLAQNGVAMVLTGHDHDYQRWVPLDASGNPPGRFSNGAGTTEFVIGTGGHSEQSFVATDKRVAAAFSNTQFGAMRMELNSSGAAYQFVTAAGQRLDSGSVQCPGTARDDVAPSTPTGLKATAVSRAEIDLSWNQSNDNVGVTGYDIFRNGFLVKSIGPDTTFADATVAPGGTYTYTVRARDARNQSKFSSSASATTPKLGVLFADGFEAGDLSQWTNNGLTVSASPVFSGSWAARAANNGAAAGFWATKKLATGQANLYYQARVYVPSQSATPINLMRFRSSATTPANLLSVMRSSSGKLQVRNETTATTSSAGPAVSLGAWHTIQVHVRINGATSQVDTWLDGIQSQTLSFSLSLGTTPIGWIDLGEPTKGRTYDVSFDEIAADTNQIPDVSAPSIPTGLTVAAASGLEADLSWTASTDDVGVVGYDIYRNGALLASTTGTGTAYVDKTVGPNRSYFYQVSARDGSSNKSGLSDLATVTTPDVFSDGFETGDMTQWDPGSTGMTPEAGSGFSGSYAAHAVALSSSAFATKTLGASPTELYYRIRFKIQSQGATSPINLLRFRTASSASLYTLSVKTTGSLAARNDVTGVTTQSQTQITRGVWHELQAHLLIQGVTGQSDVYLDGEPVSALSKVDNFATTGIGKLELGDSTALRTFDVMFDDALATGNFIEDDSAPAAASDLVATSTAGNKVTLSWAPATDNIAVTSYDIYRDGLVIQNIPPGTTYADTSVQPGTSYLYEVRANDKAGNTSDGSNQLTVTTPALDTSPPSKPAGLSATAAGATEVDLQWDASTDDVGVTEYRVSRDGSLIKTVDGNTTSFQDLTAKSDKTYSYTVAAADAAGNVSDPSDAASATTPHQAFFADGFESGSLATNGWVAAGGATVQQAHVASGAWGASASTTGTASWAWAPLPSAQTDVTYSMSFVAASAWTGTTALLKMRSATGGSILGVQVSSAGKLAVRDDAAATPKTISSQTLVSTGTWHTLQAHLLVAGTLSSYQVTLDGTPVAALSGTDDFGTAPVGRIQFADNSGGKTYELYFDDVDVEVP
ncbi:MAG TPA: metallophosphoesterase [Thermoleophilaceae bacterium]|nr:metallophosphoesterase [Thermoleophilaceae bacterium]